MLNQKEGQLTPAMEDYLEMAYRLCSENDYARVGQLAKLLNVKASSVSKMILKLSQLGYIKSDRYESIKLTESGTKLGRYLLKRHETIERFMTMLSSPDVLEETELIEHSLGAETVTSLSLLLDLLKNDEMGEKILVKFKALSDTEGNSVRAMKNG